MEWNDIPSFKDVQTENQIKFGKMGGYQFSYSYIKYINDTYGWDTVKNIVKGESFQRIFGNTDMDIYNEWVGYLGKSK